MKFSKNWFVVLLLLGIIIYCYARTLGSYFLEDDFGEVAYVAKIVGGNWQLLLSNFTGNYMQIQTMQVYRPWLLLSLLFDFLFWHTNAFGYYLTNIVFMYGAGLMLYAVARQLTKTWGRLRSFWASLITAALFVANPLHSEAISIVVGRVDIICCFFYLLSLWCILKRGIKNGDLPLVIIGTVAFWLAILTKEMAVGLPVLVAGIGAIMPELASKSLYEEESLSNQERRYSLAERVATAIRLSLPLWLSLIAYFIIRYLALGTLVGGYAGSIGAGQTAHLWEHWRDLDTIRRIFYPLNLQVFGVTSIYHAALNVIYFLLGALLLSRWISQGLPWRWLALLSFWSITTVLPIYRLWGLSENLDGSRFLFFLTMPLAAFLPVCLLAPVRKDTFYSVNFKLELSSLFCLLILILTDSKIAYRNNIPWLHAGRQTRACLKQAQSLAGRIGSNKRAILLGLPTEREGARMILNGITFDMMVSPPFTKKSLTEKFILFTPVIYGNDELINMQRYKEAIADPNTIGTYIWNYDKLKFDQLKVPDPLFVSPAAAPIQIVPTSSTIGVYPYCQGQGGWRIEQDATISMTGNRNESSIALSPLEVNPLEYDFLEFDLAREPGANLDKAAVYWMGQNDSIWQDSYRPETIVLPAQAGQDFQKVRLPLSRHWRWLSSGSIVKLRLDLPASKSMKVKNLQLVSAGNLVPELTIERLKPDNTGVYCLGKEPLNLIVDGACVPDCESVRIELSKPNFFFENQPESTIGTTASRAEASNPSAVLKSFVCQGAPGNLKMLCTEFPSPGYFQLRATCLDKDKKPIGERSDSLTLFKTD